MLFRDYSNSMVMSEKHKFAIACKRPYLLHLTVLHPPAPSTPDILYNISTQLRDVLLSPATAHGLRDLEMGRPCVFHFAPGQGGAQKTRFAEYTAIN